LNRAKVERDAADYQVRPQLSWIEHLPSNCQPAFDPMRTHEESPILTGLISTFELLLWGPIWTKKDPKTDKWYQIAVSDLAVEKRVVLEARFHRPPKWGTAI